MLFTDPSARLRSKVPASARCYAAQIRAYSRWLVIVLAVGFRIHAVKKTRHPPFGISGQNHGLTLNEDRTGCLLQDAVFTSGCTEADHALLGNAAGILCCAAVGIFILQDAGFA